MRSSANEVQKARERVFPVARLRPMALRGDDDDAVAGQAGPGQAFQTAAYVRGQRGRAARVKTKLHRACNFVDVLPAGSGCSDEKLGNLAFIKRDLCGDRNHDGFLARIERKRNRRENNRTLDAAQIWN